jgi:hypothetical protein
MKPTDIEIVRLALTTCDNDTNYISRIKVALSILDNEYKSKKLTTSIPNSTDNDVNSLSDVTDPYKADENAPLFTASSGYNTNEGSWNSTDYLRGMCNRPIEFVEVKPEVKPVFLGRIAKDTTEEQYLELLEGFIEDLPAYTVKFVYNDSRETVFEIIK